MRLQEYNGKRKTKIFEYDITGGLNSVCNTSGRKVVEMENLSHISYPCISPREPFHTWEINNPIESLGSIDNHIYHTSDGYWYCDKIVSGTATSGDKNFLNFNSKVLMFPDKKSLDPKARKVTPLVVTKTVTVVFINSDLGINAIKNSLSSINLADHYYPGQGILISGSGKSIVDGYHYITGVDKENGILYFNNYEFGTANINDTYCTITNEIPDMDSVCICQNRVWGVKGNTVYASKVGDPKSFCAFSRDGDCSYKFEYPDTDGFTYIMEYGGSPILFSKSAIYKIYGDNSKNYEIDIVYRGGGMLQKDVKSVAEIDNEVYYVSHGRVVKFTGVKSTPVDSFPYSDVSSACGGARDGVYYISYVTENMENIFLTYDVTSDSWYKQAEFWINRIVMIQDYLYGLSENKVYLMSYNGTIPIYSETEVDLKSYFVLDEVFDMGRSLYPERVILRADINFDSKLQLEICYDSSYFWETVGEVFGEKFGITYFSIPLKKCDSFKLRFSGTGPYCVKNVAVECMVE